ncbi:hypothetical protein KV102_02575 [Mumia sp. zg.B53]|uniref:hypothetical protein n=1 Tax=unclassified Mumia TaxID=2621872 RepID=UPI001C6E595B|nr:MULTISPECIES: hypothetical protein [unclassified Mumia]MBW9204893.1 hypothetical protein [Mumia sp. zg.B17]MBW9209103.1 hypothetical protein [Mumia sp. zg.B21]MBW9213714.1 hypothetical protein [Mumia sp. zg.B53]MDD9350194.1 hypothetical protein [Mumia sp.]
MRWDERFDALETDLALQADGESQAERDRQIEDLAVERSAAVSWADRCLGREIVLSVTAVGLVRGELAMATADWVLLHHDVTTDWVVSMDAVLSVTAGTGAPLTARGEVQRRTTWRQAWATFVRDRDVVVVVLVDGSTVRGTPTRAGSDYAEIGGELVPYTAVAAVRCPR